MMGDAERIYYPGGGPWITHGEICDTLEALWKVARAAEEFRKTYGKNGLELNQALAALREEKT